MKKGKRVLLSLIFLLSLSGCNKPSSSDVSVTSYDDESKTSTVVDSTTDGESFTSVPPLSDGTSEVSSTSEEVYKKTINYFSNSLGFGNTNGNAKNSGLAVYDHTHNVHYFVVKQGVYQFDPSNSSVSPLFYTDKGYVSNLSLSGNKLFFTNLDNNYVYCYDLISKVVTEISTYTTSALYIYSDLMFMDINKIYYEVATNGIERYRITTGAFLDSFAPSVRNTNMDANKIIYTYDSPIISLMADNFMGKTNIKSFSESGFKAINYLLLIAERYGSPISWQFALILENDTKSALYLYDTKDDTLVLVRDNASLHSVNTDGTNLYWIENNILFSYSIELKDLVLTTPLYLNARYVNVINHYIYTSDNDRTTLYRINPATGNLELAI